MKVTIDLDERYANILAFTAIGMGEGFTYNVYTAAVDLSKGTDLKMVRGEGVKDVIMIQSDTKERMER